MQYRLDLIESGLNYYLNSNHKKYLAQTQRPIFLRFGKFPPQICESYGATYWLNWKKNYCLALCKVHLVLQQTIETTSNSIHNWRRYPSSNCYKIDENVRFWIWHSVVAPSDAAEKTAISMHNYNPSCTNSPGDIWENLLPVWLRWPCWTVDELMNLELLTSHIFYSKSYMLCMRQTLNNKVIYKQRSLKKTQTRCRHNVIQCCGTGVPSGVVQKYIALPYFGGDEYDNLNYFEIDSFKFRKHSWILGTVKILKIRISLWTASLSITVNDLERCEGPNLSGGCPCK